MTIKNDIAGIQIKKISEFHKGYEKDYLSYKIKNKDLYLRNPKGGLFFILSYSFYQGRRDEVSKIFEVRAEEALEEILGEHDFFSSNYEYIPKEKIKGEEYERRLRKSAHYAIMLDILEEKGVNKRADRLMVVGLINLIESFEEKNLLKVIIEKIKSRNIERADRLLKDVWSIGPKIAALILRDTIYIYHLERYLDKKVENYYFVQPVDTWVHQISRSLGMINLEKCRNINKKTREEECNIYRDEPKDITDACWQLGVNPIYYNQGAWYLASNSLDILIANLDKL